MVTVPQLFGAAVNPHVYGGLDDGHGDYDPDAAWCAWRIADFLDFVDERSGLTLPRGAPILADMRFFVLLLIHLVVSLVKLLGPGGAPGATR